MYEFQVTTAGWGKLETTCRGRLGATGKLETTNGGRLGSGGGNLRTVITDQVVSSVKRISRKKIIL
jgi:hypothetical protein